MKKLPVIPEDLFELISVEDPQISPDGNSVLFVQMQPLYLKNEYQRKIVLLNLQTGSIHQLTPESQHNSSPRWSPDGRTICFVSTRNGKPQLYLLPVDGGEAKAITALPNGISAPVWSPDGQWIAFLSQVTSEESVLEDEGVLFNSHVAPLTQNWVAKHHTDLKDPRVITKLPYRTGISFFDGLYQHVYVMPAAGGTPQRLTSGMFHHSAVSWSPDSRYVVTNSNREQSNGDEFFELWSTIIKIDIHTKQETIVAFEVSEEGRAPLVSPDGKWVAHYFVPKVESPYAEPYHIAITPLAGGESILVSNDALTVIDFKWSPDSQHLYFLTHDHGDGKVVKINLQGRLEKEIITGARQVVQFAIAQDSNKLVFSATSPVVPSELFSLNQKTGHEERLTHFNDAWVEKHYLSEPVEINYTGHDDTPLQGWYYPPMDFDPSKKYPVCVEIHGGPQIMWGNTFWHEFQVLVSKGYFVFFCNPRGSSGYGADFQRLRGKGGYTDMPDIMDGLDEVLKREQAADSERLVVTGGSYGGFLTGWVVTHTDRFKAAVSQRGVYDELNMFGSGDIPESVEWYHGGIPSVENLQELWDYSPAAHAKDVVTPLMILHSELDYRVPISQAETFFAALRRHGNRDAVMVRFPREGHELSRSGEPHHRVERINKIVSWFEQHINLNKNLAIGVNMEQFNLFLGEFSNWHYDGKQLECTYDCGNFDLAAAFVQRLAELLHGRDNLPSFTIDGRVVRIQFFDESIRNTSLAQLTLARLMALYMV